MIFHEVNCSSAYVIYLMECTLCKKQCVGKSETSFNISLNYHRKNIKKSSCHINMQVLTCRYFQRKKHSFNKLAKFIIIDKFTNTTKSKDILRQRFIERENFRIQTLQTLLGNGLNQELSN